MCHKMNYQVTLAMPVYNVSGYIERSLLSALNQTFASIEFLIIDDKGTDNSIEIVERIMREHPRGKDIRIIDHMVNRGTGATKNSAIKEATGEYLYFMDSDDVITPDCIDILYQEMKKNPVDFVAASFQKVSFDGDMLSANQFQYITSKESYALAKYRKGQERSFYIMTWNKLYDLSFLKRNNITCIPHSLNEDVWFSFQLYYYTSSFTFLDAITYNWYVRNDSTTNVTKATGLTVQKVNTYLEVLDYEKKAICLNSIATDCPYIIDDIIEFCLRLSEGVLRSNLSETIRKELIMKITMIDEIKSKYPIRWENKVAFYLFGIKNSSCCFIYLSFLHNKNRIQYAILHPLITLRKIVK